MKKSEKIEIRISPEDKDALAKRAETEGRPASEIVRALLQSGGVTAHTQTVPERKGPPLAWLAGAFGAGIALGLVPMSLATGARGDAGQPAVVLTFTVQGDIHRTGEIMSRREAVLTLPADKLSAAQAFIATGDATGFELTVDEAADDGILNTRFDICFRTEAGCAPLASPFLTRVGGTSVKVQAETLDGLQFYVTLHPSVTP